jgi:serine/threonine-protein kinase
MSGGGAPRLFHKTPSKTFGEGGSFSYDGRWLAYVSDESGNPEVYVRSFPDGRDQRRISTDGGVSPRWARSGSNEELYYQHDDQIMAVGLTTQPSLTIGKTRVQFEGPFERGFDVTRDGRRFLMMSAVEGHAATQVNVVLNWFEVLKAKLPRVVAK